MAPIFSPTSTSRYINREDLECRSGVEAFLQNRLGYIVGVLEDILVGFGRTDGGNYPLADTGDYCFFGCAADEALDVGSDRDTRAGL